MGEVVVVAVKRRTKRSVAWAALSLSGMKPDKTRGPLGDSYNS